MGWKLLQLPGVLTGIVLPGVFPDDCGRLPYCGDCLVGDAGSVEFLKPCISFGAAVFYNISDKILCGL